MFDWEMVIASFGFIILGMIFVFGCGRYYRGMKLLEIEALKIQQTNLTLEVKQAVKSEMDEYKERVHVLEEIVTTKDYDLSEKISKIK